MVIVDNIPVFNRYPVNENEAKDQLNKIYWSIQEYKIVLSLNQVLLLSEYERNLRVTLHTLLEEIYKESLSYGLKNEFFINWVITDEDIKNLDIDKYKLSEVKQYQTELNLIEKIKAVSTGGCNCERD